MLVRRGPQRRSGGQLTSATRFAEHMHNDTKIQADADISLVEATLSGAGPGLEAEPNSWIITASFDPEKLDVVTRDRIARVRVDNGDQMDGALPSAMDHEIADFITRNRALPVENWDRIRSGRPSVSME
jgi:hypothetical protein